jgi:hypothetical protein
MTVAVEMFWFINISSTFLKVILYTAICRIAWDLTSCVFDSSHTTGRQSYSVSSLQMLAKAVRK